MSINFAIDFGQPSAEDESTAVTFDDLCDLDVDLGAPPHPRPINRSTGRCQTWAIATRARAAPPPSGLCLPQRHSGSSMDVGALADGTSPPPEGRSSMKKGDRTSKARPHKAKPAQRPHYAVEKRYRSSLNEKYAALTLILLGEDVQRICQTDQENWTVQLEGAVAAASKDEQGAGIRRSKTATLSATIEAIAILTRCCEREAQKLEGLRTSVKGMRDRVRQVLETDPSPSTGKTGPEQ